MESFSTKPTIEIIGKSEFQSMYDTRNYEIVATADTLLEAAYKGLMLNPDLYVWIEFEWLGRKLSSVALMKEK